MHRSIAILVLVVIGIAGTGQEAQAQANGTYAARRLVAFRQVRGQWAFNNRARARGLTFRLDRNNRFILALPNTWFGTISGRAVRRRDGVHFEGWRAFRTIVGYSYTRVQGRIFVRNRRVFLEYLSESGSAIGAYINRSEFGVNASNVYVARVELRRVR